MERRHLRWIYRQTTRTTLRWDWWMSRLVVRPRRRRQRRLRRMRWSRLIWIRFRLCQIRETARTFRRWPNCRRITRRCDWKNSKQPQATFRRRTFRPAASTRVFHSTRTPVNRRWPIWPTCRPTIRTSAANVCSWALSWLRSFSIGSAFLPPFVCYQTPPESTVHWVDSDCQWPNGSLLFE